MLTLAILESSFGDTVINTVIALLIVLLFFGMEPLISGKKSKTIEVKEAEKQRQQEEARLVIWEKAPDDDDVENSELVRRLIALDDARLTEIIENPLFYKDNCIRKARSILGRRHAWENIKNLSDCDLISIVTTDKHLYDESMIGAASMELYQRDSQLLYGEIHKMSWATIKSIANGTLAVPEGIRLAAQNYLSRNK